MTNRDFIEELAQRLDVEIQEADRLLNGFYSGMVTELLAVRKLSIEGLGTFTVKHIPLKKTSTALSVIYTPPCNILVFDSRISGSNDTWRIAVTSLFMTRGDARRFAKILGSVFAKALNQQQEICINGFGRFFLDSGTYRFFAEPSLEMLFNREYQDLEEVVISQQDEFDRVRKKSRYVLSFSAVFLVCLLLFFFYKDIQYREISHRSIVLNPQGTVIASVKRDTPMRSVHVIPAVHLDTLSRKEVNADSLVLLKNSYTIVLVTFMKEVTVHKEALRLHSEGIMAFVLPAYEKEIKYYRLVTGSFSSHQAAVERINRMPTKIFESAYIQQVKKTVVLHGEKGL